MATKTHPYRGLSTQWRMHKLLTLRLLCLGFWMKLIPSQLGSVTSMAQAPPSFPFRHLPHRPYFYILGTPVNEVVGVIVPSNYLPDTHMTTIQHGCFLMLVIKLNSKLLLNYLAAHAFLLHYVGYWQYFVGEGWV